MVTVLWDGYRVPFLDSPPPLSRTLVLFPTYRAGSPQAQALQQEVEAMLAKGALEIAQDLGPGFYSCLFLVEKASGGWRPVIDLSPERVRPADSVQDGNSCFCTVICQRGGCSSFPGSEGRLLSDPNPSIFEEAIEVHVGGDGLPVSSPCFGLSTAPQVFTRVFPAVSAWAHSHGIRLLRYLDDWLVLSSSEREAKQAVQLLLSLCRTLGIVINEKKLDLVPSQTVKYLDMTIDTEAGKVFPSLA